MTSYDDVMEFPAGTAADLFEATGRRYASGCAMLEPLGTGTLAIKTSSGAGAVRTLDVAVGQEIRVRAVSLEAETTVAVRVFWRVDAY